jgi:hypothetical protein
MTRALVARGMRFNSEKQKGIDVTPVYLPSLVTFLHRELCYSKSVQKGIAEPIFQLVVG